MALIIAFEARNLKICQMAYPSFENNSQQLL
jgi:hypothetical protein